MATGSSTWRPVALARTADMVTATKAYQLAVVTVAIVWPRLQLDARHPVGVLRRGAPHRRLETLGQPSRDRAARAAPDLATID